MENICCLPLGLHPAGLQDVLERDLDGRVGAVEGTTGKSRHGGDGVTVLVDLDLRVDITDPLPLKGRDTGTWEAEILREDLWEDGVVEESEGVGWGEEELGGEAVGIFEGDQLLVIDG